MTFLGNDLPDHIFLPTRERKSPISNLERSNGLSVVDRATLTSFAMPENPDLLTVLLKIALRSAGSKNAYCVEIVHTMPGVDDSLNG